MPKLILTSKAAILDATGKPYPGVIEALREVYTNGSPTIVLSNLPKPRLWDDHGFLKFHECGFIRSRGSGKIVGEILAGSANKGLRHSDIIVLGAKDRDFFMAVNSRSLLIRCDWAAPLEDRIANYGVPFAKPANIPAVVRLLEGGAPWYFVHTGGFLTIYAQTNAGTKFETDAKMIRLVESLRNCLKSGAAHLAKAFMLHFLSSIYSTEQFSDVDVWGFYPSSNSTNIEEEIMADFCREARVTFGQRTRGPLFIRHKASPRRHLGGGDRTDPTSQLATVHLNPRYRGRLQGKTVAVLDDYLTYGVSFGVAAALLKSAGAAHVFGAALGKFGSCANCYRISINSDPFAPLDDYSAHGYTYMDGQIDANAQSSFLDKFLPLL
jgi:hypothetical protein